MIKRTEGYFKGYENTELFYQTWLQENSNGTLVVTHGIAEHSECYAMFAEGIQSSGWDIFSMDLRGHGRSEGKRGFVEDFFDYCRDLVSFVELVKERQGHEKPIVLLGHSMGGLIVTRTMIANPSLPLKGFVLSSPAFGIGVKVPVIKDKAAGLLSKYLPRFTMHNEIGYDKLTHDKELVKSYPKDPLRHDKISPRLYLGMLDSFKTVYAQASTIKKPLLMQLAGQEHIVSKPSAIEVFEIIGSELKSKIEYPHSFHEIYNDLQRSQAFSDLSDFLKKLSE